jgi:hypothetical protein
MPWSSGDPTPVDNHPDDVHAENQRDETAVFGRAIRWHVREVLDINPSLRSRFSIQLMITRWSWVQRDHLATGGAAGALTMVAAVWRDRQLPVGTQ